jgi:[methyl-Co(III) methanol-specific corrinoid protein]:coenzyme M methyltransferase
MRDVFSPKERLTRVLGGEKADRPPVICPGGMMNSAIVDVMKSTGHTLPAAHGDRVLMQQLATDVQALTGFENIGVPFCMTVEAEALGSEIDFGTLECEPKIKKEAFAAVEDVQFLHRDAVAKSRRGVEVIEAVHALSAANPDVPVIGSVSGPVSVAASLVDPMTFLKQLRKNREMAHKVMEYVTDQIIAYALLLADNGASAISIADPTATGEILGPRFFDEYAVPYLNRITDAVHSLGVPVIVHVCGDVNMIKPGLGRLSGNAISVDAMIPLRKLKRDLNERTVMGNVSTYLLQAGQPDKVRAVTRNLVEDKIDIIAPACGLSTSTPLSNIQAMTGQV